MMIKANAQIAAGKLNVTPPIGHVLEPYCDDNRIIKAKVLRRTSTTEVEVTAVSGSRNRVSYTFSEGVLKTQSGQEQFRALLERGFFYSKDPISMANAANA